MKGHFCIYSCGVKLLEMSSKHSHCSRQTNQFLRENILNNARVRRIPIAMNTNSAFTGSHTEILFWCQQFDLKQIKILEHGQPNVNFHPAASLRPYVTTMQARNCQYEFHSIGLDNFKHHCVLLFEMSSMEDATEKCQYTELKENH